MDDHTHHSDFKGDPQRCTSTRCASENSARATGSHHAKRVHQQYGNCWCKACHQAQISFQAESCHHVRVATATNLRRRNDQPLHLPKPVRLNPVHHKPPQLRTVDKLTASQRITSELWGIIDNRRAEGGKQWDDNMIFKAKAQAPKRVRHKTVPKLVALPKAPSFSATAHKLRPPNLPDFCPIRRKALFTQTAVYMPRMQTSKEAVAQQRTAYMAMTGLKESVIGELYEEFRFEAKPHRKTKNEMLDQSHFHKLCKRHKINSTISGLLFRRTENMDRVIDFGDYLSIVAVFIGGTKELQAITLFKLCDADFATRDPATVCDISRFCLQRYLTAGLVKDKKIGVNRCLANLIEIVKPDEAGNLSLDNWVSAITQDPTAWELFSELSPFRQL